MFSSQVTKLEIELVKTKQQLGDALNQIQDLEGISFNGPIRQSKTVVNVRKSRNMSEDRASEESADDPSPTKKDKFVMPKMFNKFMKK
jgi:hypothetical protein